VSDEHTEKKGMDYSDEEKRSNYEFLMNAIRHIERQERITEDWMEEHKDRILVYRDFWPDLSRLNPDVSEYKFRAWAVEVETLLSSLCEDIRVYKTFSVPDYHRFNLCMHRMADTLADDSDFADMMSMLKF
jgi:hypothetical protein